MSDRLRFGFDGSAGYPRLAIAGPLDVMQDALAQNPMDCAGQPPVTRHLLGEGDRMMLAVDSRRIGLMGRDAEGRALSNIHLLINHLGILVGAETLEPDPFISFDRLQRQTEGDGIYGMTGKLRLPKRIDDRVNELAKYHMARMALELKSYRIIRGRERPPQRYKDHMQASVTRTNLSLMMHMTSLVSGGLRQGLEDSQIGFESKGLHSVLQPLVYVAGLVAVAYADRLLSTETGPAKIEHINN